MTMCKRELRKSRLAVLAKIDRLDAERCDFCINGDRNHSAAKSNCGCEAAVKIRQLGIHLYELTPVRKDDSGIWIENLRKSEEHVSFDTLTIELYRKMKVANMNDRAIVKFFRVGSRRLVKWKKDNGLSGNFKKEESIK
ncbi:hypothetical protein FQ087_18795 [Sporosarcina sp. ANT_H38]|uniref:hypothetical protein n=1 Tax=Sporosarcina sp. ANT_H38 TaxID=2597358 RepID=UPI0011F33C9E|nr:hypothetical protein [Sporosarcina sp. ANT_H38]KAA0944173.1 hypothetical protein FQ087_18795 [Sporosarcina sp. ANT_H38]